ncbi:MAG: RNA polymerase sigma factor [Lentisphaerae bacterium]|nr:RNA polymerase sigma factor [Lentisphaerota bacterium]MCP4101311.1 RNA polymerase sigma factor [Lentisphaerota bacterium]
MERQCRNNQEKAVQRDELTLLLTELEAPLLRYAWRFLQDESMAKDAVQEAFIQLSRQKPGKVIHAKAWLYRAVHNKCINILRKNSRRSETGLDCAPPTTAHPGSAPDAGIKHDETRALLMRCFSELTPREREIITLKVECNKSYQEISQVMNVSVSNVGFILHKAMKQLKQKFNEEYAK